MFAREPAKASTVAGTPSARRRSASVSAQASSFPVGLGVSISSLVVSTSRSTSMAARRARHEGLRILRAHGARQSSRNSATAVPVCHSGIGS